MRRGGDGTRVLGGVAGLLLGIVPAAVGLLVPDWDILVPAGGLGAISGAVLGWRYGSDAADASWPGALLLALRMAVLAVLLGDVLLCVGIALSSSAGGAESFLFALAVLPVIGLIVVGPPALGLALACAGAWVVVMRTLVRPSPTA